MEAQGSWSFNFFINNKILTNEGDPWMMGAAANQTEGYWGTAKSNDWDIYPRPSTKYMDNQVGLVLDPMAVHNYAMDDGNAEWSDAEKQQLKLTYTFASFYVGDTASWQAQANQSYLDAGVETPCMSDTFPLVTGK
jgi:hypothetical protein